MDACILDSKREVPKPPTDDGSEVEREDEQPTVVVLKGDDISEEEYQQYRERMKQSETLYVHMHTTSSLDCKYIQPCLKSRVIV